MDARQEAESIVHQVQIDAEEAKDGLGPPPDQDERAERLTRLVAAAVVAVETDQDVADGTADDHHVLDRRFDEAYGELVAAVRAVREEQGDE